MDVLVAEEELLQSPEEYTRSAAVQRQIVLLHNVERAVRITDGNGQPRAVTAAAAGGGGILPQLRRDGQHHSAGTEMERPEPCTDDWIEVWARLPGEAAPIEYDQKLGRIL